MNDAHFVYPRVFHLYIKNRRILVTSDQTQVSQQPSVRSAAYFSYEVEVAHHRNLLANRT